MPAVDGIVSGFDTTALIEAISTAYSGPLALMEADLEDTKATLDKVAGLSNRLEDLSTAIETLQGDDGLLAFTASPSIEGAFTAEVSAGITPGTYTVQVDKLATNETEVSVGVSDPDAMTLNTGTFSVTYQGQTYDLTVDGTNNSLTDLAAQIDGIDGLSAYVLDTRDGSGSPFKLVVNGDATGADATIELDATGLTGTGTALSFTEQTSASDAELSVNGVAVKSATNSFTGIPGLSLDLQRSGDGPVQLTVGLDDDAMVANVQAFVDAYNEVVNYYDQNTSFDSENNIMGALVGDSTARRTMAELGTMVTTPFAVAGSPFSALSQVGISTNRDGTLSLDSEKLTEALASDLDGVKAMFSAETGPLGELKEKIDLKFVDAENGTLSSREESLQGDIEDLELRIEDQELRLADYTAYLRDRFTAMEVAMSQFEATGQYLAGMFASDSQK